MLRYFGSAFRIIAIAVAGLIVLAFHYPLLASLMVIALYFLGLHLQKQQSKNADVLLLSPIEYEQHCAAVLQNAGWQVKSTPRQDQGVDVVADLRGVRAVIQAKRWNKRVPNSAIQEVVAGKRHYGGQVAVVVAPSGYTRSACELAASNGVHLLHHSQLAGLEKIARIP